VQEILQFERVVVLQHRHSFLHVPILSMGEVASEGAKDSSESLQMVSLDKPDDLLLPELGERADLLEQTESLVQ